MAIQQQAVNSVNHLFLFQPCYYRVHLRSLGFWQEPLLMAAVGVCPCSCKYLFVSGMESSCCNVSALGWGIFANKAIGNIGDQPCIICPLWQNYFHRCTADWRTLVVTRAGIQCCLPTRRRAATCHDVRRECYSVKLTCEKYLGGLLNQMKRY